MPAVKAGSGCYSKRPVDLLEEKAIQNPYFKQAVHPKRQLVYGH
jgi:hypothetical protein